MGGEILLINDSTSRFSPEKSHGTYCEIIKCLESLDRDYFLCAKWDSESNSVELRAIRSFQLCTDLTVP